MKNYFRVIDPNGTNLIISCILCIIIIVISSIYKIDSDTCTIYVDVNLYYSAHGIFWNEPLFYYIIPFLSSLILGFAFFKDYNDNSIEIMTFYNKGIVNRLFTFKAILHLTIFIFVTIISILIYYEELLINVKSIIVILIIMIPPVVYINGITLFFTAYIKNIYFALTLNFVYIINDVLSGGRMFRILTLQCNSQYLSTYKLLYINRTVLFCLGVLFFILACRKANKI